MRALAIVSLLFTASVLAQAPNQTHSPTPGTPAQAPSAAADPTQSPFTLRSTSSLVLIPAQVQTKKGEIVYGLTVKQFIVEDNGVPQTIRLDEDTDALGLSVVVLVQCSRSAFEQFGNMAGLSAMVDDLTGGAPREVAVVSYGSEPTLLTPFTSDPDKLDAAFGDLQPCETSDAATLDAVDYANALFDADAATSALTRNRRAILLIGETRDHGSHHHPETVLANLGRTNTVVDAVSFSPGKTDILNSLLHGGGPGPFGLLISAVQALRRNVPHTLASLTGGEYTNFTTQKGFDRGIHRLSNHIHNYYLLSFQPPADNAPGLHRLTVKVPDEPEAELRYRLTYYSGAAAPPEVPEDKKDKKGKKNKNDEDDEDASPAAPAKPGPAL